MICQIKVSLSELLLSLYEYRMFALKGIAGGGTQALSCHLSLLSSSVQKPKQKDWHPPDGFILGLWTLILLVFFKTYGMKHLKHIF